MPNINLNYKMVTDIKNNFFTNNRFIAAESLPAEGDFVKGDLIVNIGENANDEAMWLCVESGNPGVWEVVGAGAGGGSSKIVTLKSRVVVNEALSEVNIGVSGFNKATDTLLVFNNARIMVEGVDYEINADSTKIVAMNGNVWNEELANDYVFDFVIFKMMNVNENGEIVVSSVNEIVKLKNNVVVNEAVNEVEIGIDGFNEGDDLTVYKNSVYMIEGIDYEVQGSKIVSLKGNWNAEGGSDYKFTFEVLKAVAKVNPDAVVGMEHLTEDVKEAIEAAGNIDLSGKQDKSDEGLVTTDKTIVGAINELFQDVDSGKQLIADAIDVDGITGDSTFAAMGEAIEGKNTEIFNLQTELAGKVTPVGTAVAGNVLSGKTFINSTGETITGTMANRGGAQTVTPGTSDKTLNAGYYSGNITIAGDVDLVAANIVSGKNIFGVTGTAKINNFPGWIISGGTWYNVASMTKSRSNAAAATVGDNIYVIGGMNGANGRSGGDNECYNTITNTWTTKTAGYGSMDTFYGVVNGNIYRSGLRGYNTYYGLNNSCYNVSTDTWTDKANLPQSRGAGGKSFVINNKYYCVGGYYTNYTQTNYCYDESTNTWTTKQDMPSVPSSNNSAMGVYNNKFYLIDSGNLYVYNPSSNTWTSETMSTNYANGNTYGHSCIGNKIYLRGSSVYYNIDTKTFHSIKGSTNTTPSGLTCSMHNDALYYFGGSYWNGSSYVYYTLGEIYIPE